MTPFNVEELENLSKKIEEEIKAEFQKALMAGMEGTDINRRGIEKNLSDLPRTLAQSLSPIFQMIGSIAGPRITAARKEKVIEQIQKKENE